MDNSYPVPGYEGLYVLTLPVAIHSVPRHVNSPICGGSRFLGARELNIRPVKGYPSVCLYRDGKKRTVYIHRILAELFLPRVDGKNFINHKDGDKANYSLGNLEWCTHKENMRHAFDTGLAPRPSSGPGDLSPAAKLSWPKVREIRNRLSKGGSDTSLAAEFGVSRSNIRAIRVRETWVE